MLQKKNLTPKQKNLDPNLNLYSESNTRFLTKVLNLLQITQNFVWRRETM